MNEKFLLCEACGNLIGRIHDAGVEMVCCGTPMQELIANSGDAAKEKHVPQVSCEGTTLRVKVGEVLHPMTEEHHISWVFLETQRGGQRKNLKPNEEPDISFVLANDEAVAAYAYCNLHGLWKAEL
ncbi:MAG: desulfoferrodoxin [Firmicutes bacterium]|nr:desulfoferrodoxin [Bacillota bacterium]